MSRTTEHLTEIYLTGDPCPLVTELSVDQVAAILADAELMNPHGVSGGFVRIALIEQRGDALVRPASIAAIMPEPEEDE